MLKKTINHKDLDGNDVETDVYFNLTKAEAIELNIRNDLEVIGRSRNNNEIMDTFKRILEMSYGVRTGSGQFIKEGFKAFAASEAYSELFMEIWTNPDYALEFIRGILPSDMVLEDHGNQSNIPANLANHPSMQGHQKPQSRHEAREQAIGEETGYPRETSNVAANPEFEEFVAWKNSYKGQSQTPPDRVSPPEAPQQVDSPPREDLI